jgi:hypothetical protein
MRRYGYVVSSRAHSSETLRLLPGLARFSESYMGLSSHNIQMHLSYSQNLTHGTWQGCMARPRAWLDEGIVTDLHGNKAGVDRCSACLQ